jgi:hypothetical protein
LGLETLAKRKVEHVRHGDFFLYTTANDGGAVEAEEMDEALRPKQDTRNAG